MRFYSLCLATCLTLIVSCKTAKNDSQLKERVGGTDSNSWQDAQLVETYLGAARAIRVNARTNMATFYELGVPLSMWKIATGRPGKGTPKGIFVIHQKETCPPWNNGRGKSAGACAADNPLGRKALWFHQGRIYGLHGVNLAPDALASVTNTNPRDRDASSGCVRNHPENIEWLYANVKVGTPVVVGLWDDDPDVGDCSGNAAACVVGDSPNHGGGGRLLPQSLPATCAMKVSYENGLANIRAEPTLTATIVAQLSYSQRAILNEKVTGDAVSGLKDWFQVMIPEEGDKMGYLHASLVDCAR